MTFRSTHTPFVLLLLAIGSTGCATVRAPLPVEDDLPQDFSRYTYASYQVGEASYYADKYDGRKTASGEVFNMYHLTAAHNVLPFGTVVRVTNLANGKQVLLRITDRGPFVDHRALDVSLRAAQKLGFVAQGVTEVHIEIAEPLPDSTASALNTGQ